MKKIRPFYMTYPLPLAYNNEDDVMKDLEYLQQLYPAEAKKYQKKIAEILDRMDYEGSMIYDVYPDKWQLYRLSETVVDMLMREEDDTDLRTRRHPEEDDQGTGTGEERRRHISDMVQILLFYEVFKRRRRTNRGYLQF